MDVGLHVDRRPWTVRAPISAGVSAPLTGGGKMGKCLMERKGQWRRVYKGEGI